MFTLKFGPLGAALSLGVAAAPALADSPVTTFGAYDDDSKLTFSTRGAVKAFPTTFGATNAFPAPGGTVFGSVTYVTPRSGIAGNGADGSIALGTAVGSPTKNVSVSFGLGIDSVSTSDFADSGALSISVARALYTAENNATFVGGYVGNLAAWGDNAVNPESYSVYASHLTSFSGFPVMFTGGWATDNTFRTDGSGIKDDGIFAGMGIGVAPSLSAGLSATKSQVNAGISTSIPGVKGLGISAGFYDVTNNVDRRQFALTIGYGITDVFGN